MTNPVQSASSIAPAAAATAAPTTAAVSKPGDPSAAFTVEVSRAASAPVYVYRLTDTATGRVLVEIPNDPTVSGAPGGVIDAKV